MYLDNAYDGNRNYENRKIIKHAWLNIHFVVCRQCGLKCVYHKSDIIQLCLIYCYLILTFFGVKVQIMHLKTDFHKFTINSERDHIRKTCLIYLTKSFVEKIKSSKVQILSGFSLSLSPKYTRCVIKPSFIPG